MVCGTSLQLKAGGGDCASKMKAKVSFETIAMYIYIGLFLSF